MEKNCSTSEKMGQLNSTGCNYRPRKDPKLIEDWKGNNNFESKLETLDIVSYKYLDKHCKVSEFKVQQLKIGVVEFLRNRNCHTTQIVWSMANITNASLNRNIVTEKFQRDQEDSVLECV